MFGKVIKICEIKSWICIISRFVHTLLGQASNLAMFLASMKGNKRP